MGPRVRKLVVAIAISALPIVAVAAPVAAANLGTAVVTAGTSAAGASDILGWVNTLRANVGLVPLTTNATLSSVAQYWAEHMASAGVLSHNPNLSVDAPSGWTKIGENIGDGYSLLATYNALVASPDHYANMVDPAYNRIGVGVATGGNGQVWIVQDFGDYPPPPTPTLVFPASGTVIFPSAQPFSWSQVGGAQYYCLTVGTTPGGTDLLNSGLLPNSQLSTTVPALPGGVLWARIYSFVQGAWTWADAKFSVTGPSTASFTRPTAGATNVSASQPFTWSPVASSAYYAVTIGSTMGGYDVANSGLLPGSQTSYTVPALPTGKHLYARVYSYIAGNWNHFSDVSFTAA